MTRSGDIRRALEQGTPLRSSRVVVYVAPSDGPPRAVCVAGRRVGGAVARNRARRLLREAWRAVRPVLHQGCDVVLVARPGIAGAKAPQVIEEVRKVLTRAGWVGA